MCIGSKLKSMLNLKCINDSKEATEASFKRLNAIAYGVETRYDISIGYTLEVIRRTIEVSRRFGIPEQDIQLWVDTRLANVLEKSQSIEFLQNKVMLDPVARMIVDEEEPYLYESRFDQSHN